MVLTDPILFAAGKNIKLQMKVKMVLTESKAFCQSQIYKCPGARKDGVDAPNKSKPTYVRWTSQKYFRIHRLGYVRL